MISLPRPFKQGDTFRLPFRVTDPTGAALDVTGWTLSSELRDIQGVLIQTFTVDLVNGGTSGQAVIKALATETPLWPTGYHWMDIQVMDGNGEVFSTVDIQVEVTEDRTRV